MATINSVQKSIHLPLTSLSSPRVLMCSASVGTEGSVTLQLRDSSDSNQSPAQTSLENALTIGYPDPEMLADVFGSLQTASFKNHSSALVSTSPTTTITNHINSNPISSNSTNNNKNTKSTTHTSTSCAPSNSSSSTSITSNTSGPANKVTISRSRNQSAAATATTSAHTAATAGTTTTPHTTGKSSAVQTVSTATNTTNKTTSSYVKNCLIRSSSCSNTNNVTSLAQIMSNSSTSSSSSLLNHSNTNSNSNCSSNSNFSSSSSSNDSIVSVNSNNSGGGVLKSGGSSKGVTAGGATGATLKKNRTKLSSPTRHGPQQCQICSKIFGNASALAKHKLTHSDERKYVCAMCSKAFKRQDHLNGHMMTHRNKKPYECKAEGCGKSYCDARSLRRHTENHHSGIITPQNQTLSPTSSTPNGLSLSPATASGDASSPDGATCIRTYISTGGSIVDAATGVALTEEQIKAINLPIKTGVTLLSPTSTSSASSVSGVSLPASSPTIALAETSLLDAGEGLTREQLDLISKIMQQTKQTSAQVTVSSPTSVNSYKVDTNPASSALGATSSHHAVSGSSNRPRTWNMQLLNTQNVSIAVDESNSDATSSTATSPIEVKEEEVNQQFVAAINPHLLNIVKMDQKQVECNLCHRKFKNIPALNGHMRLHGGYFKKDPETKKTEKKEPSGPPLQTASIGVRALIEEKIISKRKDMNKGAFVVPAPPSSVSSTSTIRRSISDLESFLSPKSHSHNGNIGGGNGVNSGNTSSQNSPTATTTTMLPAATTIKNFSGGTLGLQQIGMSQGIEIFSTKQQKTVGNGSHSLGMGLSAALQANNATMNPSTMKSAATTNTTTTKGTSTDPKDSTLIELLKRGTRIAVTAKKPLNSTNPLANMGASSSNNGNGGSRQIITNNNRTVIIPSDVQVLPTRMAKSSANALRSTTPASLALTDTTPLSLTISQSGDGSMGGDVYTVTYSSDTSGFFDDAEVYNVADTDMLLQTVDSMQLLNEDSQQIKSEHSEQFGTVTGVGITDGDQTDNSANCIQAEYLKLEADGSVNAMPTTLPTFQQFHSKELIMQNSAQIQAVTSMRSNAHQLGTLSSPINSPLAYPTPPSSHENMAQSSPYVDDGHQYSEVTNTFFNEKCNADFLTQSATEVTFFKSNDNQQELTDTEKILKLKTVLEESAFDGSIKVEDLLNGTQDDDTECDLRDFAESNLAFLDEDQEFLNDSRNATSPLPESFFTGSIGTAEEVKEVLRDVLPDENINLNCEEQSDENIIDLYYLPGLGLQSQMMPNSDDPLLSSSPRDFGQQRGQIIQTTQQIQVQQQHQQQQQQNQSLSQSQQMQQSTQQLLYAQQMEHQMQQQQQQQTSTGGDYVGNQLAMAMQQTAGDGNDTTPATLQYNLQNLPQVQNQQQYIDVNTPIQHVSSLDGGILHQQLVFTGSTDKQEIHITGQQGDMGLLSASSSINTDTNIYFASNSSNSNNSMSTLQQLGSQSSTCNLPISSSSSCQPPTAATVISTLQPLSNQTNSILKRRLRPHNSSDSCNSQSFAKYHPLSPYRSKLRKPSRTHYTPAPILNPDRKGVGLYCSVRKQLNTGLLGFDSFDDDFDDPVGLVDFSDESKVNLGSAYQAQLPPCRERIHSAGSDAATDGELCKTTSCFDVEEPVGAEQLWDPTVQTDEKILMRYIDLSKSSAVPLGSHTEEVALHTLLKAQGNMAAAVLTLLQTQSNAFQMKWSATELEVFLKGLERHGKDFGRISLELGSKTTGECVHMYYFWKKLCVDYKVSHLKTETPPPPPVNDPKPYVCEVPDCSASF